MGLLSSTCLSLSLVSVSFFFVSFSPRNTQFSTVLFDLRPSSAYSPSPWLLHVLAVLISWLPWKGIPRGGQSVTKFAPGLVPGKGLLSYGLKVQMLIAFLLIIYLE